MVDYHILNVIFRNALASNLEQVVKLTMFQILLSFIKGSF